mmetsp:Transcript_3365/g.4622  ORF Transcript_3365/g.4622 Transcript_3365/m.4622 type:complete len:204 (+) Transcript_3365:57-668(+)
MSCSTQGENQKPCAPSDEDILDFIFNPYGATPVTQPKTELKDEFDEYNEQQLTESRTLELAAIKLAESCSVEKGKISKDNESKLEEALSVLEKALQITPKNPSLYNNRAQILRLKGDIEGALKDLDTSIQFCTAKTPLSAKQAYTQRGFIKELKEDMEGARQDFEIAASLGSSIAASEATKLNPFARLCNQMLAQAFTQGQYK